MILFLSLYDWRGHMDPGNKQAIIPVREASRLMRSCTLKNFGGLFRVVLIWQAQKMNAESGNKLLKLIEEPPEGTLFLLIAPLQMTYFLPLSADANKSMCLRCR